MRRRARHKESGRRRWTGAAGEQAWGVGGWGLLILQNLTAHSSRSAFQVRKPGFLIHGNTLGMSPGASGIRGNEGLVWGAPRKRLVNEMGE